MGALALIAAFLVGTLVAGASKNSIIGGFPGDLFVILVGVTYLFAIARANGTVDWLVRGAVRAVRGRVALIPWMMFLVTAVLTALGAVVPAAVAIIAPIGMGFAVRYRIRVAGIGVPLLAAFVICLIGGAVSAFASTTGILGALIPLAVPFPLTGQVGAVGLVIALSISASVVDSSPFSTSGALVVANAEEADRDSVFSGLMRWGMSMIVVAPIVSWLVFVAPGWL